MCVRSIYKYVCTLTEVEIAMYACRKASRLTNYRTESLKLKVFPSEGVACNANVEGDERHRLHDKALHLNASFSGVDWRAELDVGDDFVGRLRELGFVVTVR